jgi:hypothetical protein
MICQAPMTEDKVYASIVDGKCCMYIRCFSVIVIEVLCGKLYVGG